MFRCFQALVLLTLLGFPFQGGADYPWRTKSDSQQKNFLELDFSTSYFIKKFKNISFPQARWSHHNTTVDLDLAYRYHIVENKHYFSLNELAVTFPLFLSPYATFTLGSRRQDWSQSDQYWNFGLWQPRYIVDPLRPSQMGLPGVYLDWSGPVSFTAFFSYFSLPDIIIYPDLVKGEIQSENPFFINPVTSGDSQSIVWKLESFQSFDWISFLKPSAAFQLKHQLPHSEISLSYAYKSVNQLQYSILLESIDLSNFNKDGKKNIVIKDLRYDTGYHHLTTAEIKLTPLEGMTFFASAFYEKPQKRSYTPGWIYDDFESHLTTSLHMELKKERSFTQTLFTLGYAKVIESKLREDKSNVITEDVELFFGRIFDWLEATSVSLEHHNKQLLSGYGFNLRLTYALDNKMYLLNFANNFYLTNQLLAYFSGDLLFRFGPPTENQLNTSAIARYRDLSRIMFGMKYVF